MKRDIYINVLLKDNMIVAYRISGNKKEYPHDYYKDFYYAGVPMEIDIDERYVAKYALVQFDDDTSSKFNNYVFENVAREYFKQWRVHPNHFGAPAY